MHRTRSSTELVSSFEFGDGSPLSFATDHRDVLSSGCDRQVGMIVRGRGRANAYVINLDSSCLIMTNLACSNNARIHTTRTFEDVIRYIGNQQHMTFHLCVLWVGFLSVVRPHLYNIRWLLSEVEKVVA